MADFNLWSKETLVELAEAQTAKLTAKDEEIEQLKADLKDIRKAWRAALVRTVAPDTLAP